MGARAWRTLSPSLESVGAGRRFVADVLTRWRLECHLDTAILLTSEVVANAVVHAATACILEAHVDVDRCELLIAVDDFGDKPVLYPIEAQGLSLLLEDPDLDAESGRGLMIVATLADRWGIDSAPGGNRVWFALSLGDARPVLGRRT